MKKLQKIIAVFVSAMLLLGCLAAWAEGEAPAVTPTPVVTEEVAPVETVQPSQTVAAKPVAHAEGEASATEAPETQEPAVETPATQAPDAEVSVTEMPVTDEAAATKAPDTEESVPQTAEDGASETESLPDEETLEPDIEQTEVFKSTEVEVATEEKQTEVENEEAVEAEIDISKLKVEIFSSMGNCVTEGETVYLTSRLTGFEGIDYTLQWEVNDGSGWKMMEFATEDHYSYEINEENVSWQWRLTVNF